MVRSCKEISRLFLMHLLAGRSALLALFATTLDTYTSQAEDFASKGLHAPILRLCEQLIFLYSVAPAANIDSELWTSVLPSLAAAISAYFDTTDDETRAKYDQPEYRDDRTKYAETRDYQQMASMLVHWISAYILPVDFDSASNGRPLIVTRLWAVVYSAFPESDRVKWVTDVAEGT